ncbi:unnamed protein product [Albugo candida]|uniref:Uncharacterized protein n=1 Tax=Albugo candida TaxID=65357 RepID=A0A024FVA3_9STRA|nr:unnamed protein product [Albugo candida]|eukprot:CCI10579.1 unnamed protein product [Albugo candida]
MDQRWETKNTGRASPIEVRTGTKLRRTDIAIFGSLCTASGQQRTKHLIDATDLRKLLAIRSLQIQVAVLEIERSRTRDISRNLTENVGGKEDGSQKVVPMNH